MRVVHAVVDDETICKFGEFRRLGSVELLRFLGINTAASLQFSLVKQPTGT
jgi:hypothetical protein